MKFKCYTVPIPLELSETGRMLSTALSDGYLTMHDESHADLSHHHHQLSMSLDSRHFIPSSDDMLFPPLTQNDRHPSAPQLVSMLTDNKADIMLHDEDQVHCVGEGFIICGYEWTCTTRVHTLVIYRVI